MTFIINEKKGRMGYNGSIKGYHSRVMMEMPVTDGSLLTASDRHFLHETVNGNGRWAHPKSYL
jgi:hypothetical protein